MLRNVPKPPVESTTEDIDEKHETLVTTRVPQPDGFGNTTPRLSSSELDKAAGLSLSSSQERGRCEPLLLR
jgi:hypothetical protein